MSYAMLYSVVACWIVVAAGLFTAFYIFKNWTGDSVGISFAWFWLVVSWLWFFTGIRMLSAWLNVGKLDETIFLLGQIFVMFHFIPLSYYLAAKLFKAERFCLISLSIYTFLSILSIFFLFKEGVTIGPITYFATKYSPKIITFSLFKFMLYTLMAGLFYLCGREFFSWIKSGEIKETTNFKASLALILYGLVGYFDEKGLTAGWSLVLLRLLMVVAVLIAYVGFSEREKTQF